MTDPPSLRLSRVDRGAGPPVVLLHSSGMSSRQWGRLVERLAPRHRVVALDLPGYGENPLWPSDARLELGFDASAVSAVIAEIGERVHLVGHSYGGLLALLITMAAPEMVRSLSLFEPVAFGVLRATSDEEAIADLERSTTNPLFHDEARGGSEAWLELFIDYWNGPGAWRALPPAARESFLRVGRKTFLEVTALTKYEFPLERWRAIQTPTLLLSGAASPFSARRVVEALARLIPRAEAAVVEGAGHMGPITHADTVNAKFQAFIDAQSG
jgi:pimeloyl-ACP methyl ester carboxylesterase